MSNSGLPKPGDKLRYLGGSQKEYLEIGKIYEVVQYDTDNGPRLNTEKGWWWIFKDQWELIPNCDYNDREWI